MTFSSTVWAFGSTLWVILPFQRKLGHVWKTLMLGKIEGRRRRGQQRMSWLDGTTNLMDMSLSKLRKLVLDREAWRAVVHGVTKNPPRLSDQSELNWGHVHGWVISAFLLQEVSRSNGLFYSVYFILSQSLLVQAGSIYPDISNKS